MDELAWEISRLVEQVVMDGMSLQESIVGLRPLYNQLKQGRGRDE